MVMDNKVGFIDQQGNMRIPCQFEYSRQKFHNSRNPVNISSIVPRATAEVSEIDDDWYYGNFSEGYAPMIKNGKYGYIDKSGNTVIPYVYTWAQKFHLGLAIMEMKVNGKEKYGLIG